MFKANLLRLLAVASAVIKKLNLLKAYAVRPGLLEDMADGEDDKFETHLLEAEEIIRAVLCLVLKLGISESWPTSMSEPG